MMGRMMEGVQGLLLAAFFIVNFIVAVGAYTTAGLAAGLSAAVVAILVFFAGSGLRGSFLVGTVSQKIGGTLAAILLLAVATWLGTQFSVHFFGLDFTGSQWGWLSFAVCFLLTTKRFTTSDTSADQTLLSTPMPHQLSLDILMHYDLATDKGIAALRWNPTQPNPSFSNEQCKIALVALVYARTLVNQKETRQPLFDRVAEAARQVLAGNGKFDFESWTLQKEGMSVCIWPWTLTEPEMVSNPKTYTAELFPLPVSGSFGINLNMAFGLELVLVPASALIAISGLAKSFGENDVARLARVLLEVNAFYHSNAKFSIGSESQALKAAISELSLNAQVTNVHPVS